MRRLALLSVVFASSCSSADFDVATAAEDAATSVDSEPVDSGVIESDVGGPADTGSGVTDASAACEPIQHSSTDVYVDANAPAGGLGSAGCPFRSLFDASNTSFATGYDRVVHVRAGTYTETKPIKIRSRETYRGEGGVAKVVAKGTATCPSTQTCGFYMETGAALNGFELNASAVTNGIYVNTGGVALTIKNTNVLGAQAEGVVITGTGATIGPNVSVLESGGSALVMRGNALLKVTGGGNLFNNSRGTGAGIHMFSGMLLLEGGTTTMGNYAGVLFDALGGSVTQQTLDQLTSQANRASGVVVGKSWSKVMIRKSVLTKNTNYGLRLEYKSDGSNVFDVGAGAAGGNVFGGAAARNGRAGIIICGSGATASFLAEGNSWTTCPAPSQEMLTGCDAGPMANVDVAYSPSSTFGSTLGAYPLAKPLSCTVGP